MLDVNAKGMKPLTKGMIEFVIDCLKREPTMCLLIISSEICSCLTGNVT